MPRVRDPERDKAREMWEASGKTLKLREIAEILRVPEKTISGWKSKDNWDKKNVRSTPKKIRSTPNDTPKRKRGGQPGNKNSKGGTNGNINAVVTGAYISIHDDLLTDEEKEIYYNIIDGNDQRRDSLLKHLAILRVRERRMLKDIADIRAGKDMLIRRTISQIEPTDKKATDGREVTKVVKINQEQENRQESLLRWEESLTRVQAEIRRTEDSIRHLDLEYLKLEATYPAEMPEELGSNFEDALRNVADDVWANNALDRRNEDSNDD